MPASPQPCRPYGAMTRAPERHLSRRPRTPAAAAGRPADDGSGVSPRTRRIVVGVLLGLIVVVGLYLRLRNNGYGLPYVYNFDEASHFVSRSINVFGGEVDPRYYQNPSGYTYLVFLALK